MAELAHSVPPTGRHSLAEDVQLVLSLGGGELVNGWVELSAAALIELALHGRIRSVPETGILARKEESKLIVVDPSATGVPILDAALARLVARGKPWQTSACLQKLGTPIARLTQETLVQREAIRRKGRVGGWRTTFWVKDEVQHHEALRHLDAAWLHPEAVSDPRDGALVDIVRNSGDRTNRGSRSEAIIRWEWYPKELRDTVYAILDAERVSTSASSGTGYEG